MILFSYLIFKTMKNKTLVLYSLLTFAITWTCWWLLAYLTKNEILVSGTPLFMILFLIGGLAPTYVPFITFALIGSKEDFTAYKQRLFKFKSKFIWYAIALMLPFIIHFLSFLLSLLFDKNAEFASNLQSWYMILPLFLMMIIGGGLEELGWRGLMLPELQKKLNAFSSTVIVGFT